MIRIGQQTRQETISTTAKNKANHLWRISHIVPMIYTSKAAGTPYYNPNMSHFFKLASVDKTVLVSNM